MNQVVVTHRGLIWKWNDLVVDLVTFGWKQEARCYKCCYA